MFSYLGKMLGLRNPLAHHTNEMLVDLSEYNSESVLIRKESDRQELTIFSKDRLLKIIVLVPHGIFEWFIDVYSNDKKVLSTWIDHYGSPREELITEMKTDLDEFISTATRYDLQVGPITSRDTKKVSLQYHSNGGWKNFDFVWSLH